MYETSDCPESSPRRLLIEQAVLIVFVNYVLFHVGFLMPLAVCLELPSGRTKLYIFARNPILSTIFTVQFVFEKTDDFCIFLAVEWMLNRIIRSVIILIDFQTHVCVKF